MTSVFDLDKYLERISVSNCKNISLEFFKKIHFGHVTKIPFENFDIHLNREINLTPQAIYEKIVLSNRGGYCFEMNGLLAECLKELGLEVKTLLARPRYNYSGIKANTHMLVHVTIKGISYLCDVGFGNLSILEPISIVENKNYSQYGHIFRVTKNLEFGYILTKISLEKDLIDLYSFKLDSHYPADFQLANYYTSTSKESIFTNNIMCSIYSIDGNKHQLLNTSYSLKSGNSIDKKILKSADAFDQIIQEIFNIKFSTEEVKGLFEKAQEFEELKNSIEQ